MNNKRLMQSASFGVLTLLYFAFAFFVQTGALTKVEVSVGYVLLMLGALGATKWVKPVFIGGSFISLILFVLFTVALYKSWLGFKFLRILFVIVFVFFILNALAAMYSVLQKKRKPFRYVGLAIFILIQLIVGYLLYSFIFGLLFFK